MIVMQPKNTSQYLDSKVLTASQPRLHLMMLEGAVRFGRQAASLWSDDASFSEADLFLAKVADIVDELVHGMASRANEISGQLEEQYAFIYRELAAGRINRDKSKLDTCLQLLDYHRETWKLACEKIEAGDGAPSPRAVPIPHLPSVPTNGLSLEA